MDAKLLGTDGKPADCHLKIELERVSKDKKSPSKSGSSVGGGSSSSTATSPKKKYRSIEQLEEESEDLAGKSFKFRLRVIRLKKLGIAWRSPRVEFQYYVDEKTVVRPKREVPGGKRDPPEYVFDYSKSLTQDPVTERYAEYLKGRGGEVDTGSGDGAIWGISEGYVRSRSLMGCFASDVVVVQWCGG